MIERLTRNAGLKILALFIAMGLWVLVSGEQESVRVFNVPLDFRLSRDRMLAGQAPGTVAVRVKGSESVLRSLTAEDLSLPVDLSTATPGRRSEHELDPRSVLGVPSGAAVDGISPGRLLVGVERKVSRTVPVTVHFEGEPARGYRIASYSIDPSEVTIEGPESEIVKISYIATEPVSIQGRHEGLTLLTGLSVENPMVRLVESRPAKITVSLVKSDSTG